MSALIPEQQRSAWNSRGISWIDVEGNEKTRAGVITQEMVLQVGDRYDKQAIEKSSQAIMDLGLFRRVNIVEEPDGNNVRLIVQLKEKEHSWYILPRIDRNSDGDITLVDINGDYSIDTADSVYLLLYLFANGPQPYRGSQCIFIAGCPDRCQ